jgi:hypothetical protein
MGILVQDCEERGKNGVEIGLDPPESFGGEVRLRREGDVDGISLNRRMAAVDHRLGIAHKVADRNRLHIDRGRLAGLR